MRRELSPKGCQTRIYGARDVAGYQCQKKPTVTCDGKLYCKIHDPEYREQKKAELKAKWDREAIEQHQRWDLEKARRQATEGLTLAELRRVTPEFIREALEKLVGGLG